MKRLLLTALLCIGVAYADSRYSSEEVVTKEVVTKEQDVLQKRISINVRGVGLPYLLSILSEQVGIPIVIRDIVYPLTGQGQTAGTGQGQANVGINEYLPITYYSGNKPLSFILDEITGHLDLFWAYEGGRIVIYKYERKIFVLNLPFLQKVIQEKSDPVEVAYKREFIKNVDNALKTLLTDQNSKVSVDEMGNVFAIARKSELQSIEKMIEGINKRFTKQIPLKVEVMVVNEEDLKDIGVSLLGGAGNTRVGSKAGAAVAAPIFSLSLLTKNIELGLSALAKAGKAKMIEDNVLIALNGQPIVYAPLRKEKIISEAKLNYIAPQTTGQGQAGAVIPQISLNTEYIESGHVMIIVPYYIDDERIVVDLYRKTMTVDRIDKTQVDLAGYKNDIYLPTTSVRTNINQTVLARGQSLVLFSSGMTIEQMNNMGVPFLKDIPLIGVLFSRKVKEDTLFRIIIKITFASEEEKNE